MILGEKIILLRKQNNLTQEELAEKLNVSRQSVSKWEMGTSIPDINKILLISEVFGVNIDYLLKDNIESIEYSDDTEIGNNKIVILEEANEFLKLNVNKSKKTAGYIAMFIFSSVPMMLLFGIAELNKNLTEELVIIFGVSILLMLVARGTFGIISSDHMMHKYKSLEEEDFTLAYGVKGVIEKIKNEDRELAYKTKAFAIALFIMSCIPVIVASMSKNENKYIYFAISIMLSLISCGVYNLIKASAVETSCNILLQEENYSSLEKKVTKKVHPFVGAYWSLISAMYLAVSFLTNKWYITWVIYAIGGILFSAINLLLRAKARNEIVKNEKGQL